jgi:hypothetical protein
MALFTVIVIGTAVVGFLTGAYFWPYIADAFAQTVIPFVRRHLGDPVANLLVTLITWIDRPMGFLHNTVQEAWRFFKQKVIRIKRIFVKTSPTEVKEKTEVWVSNGKPFQQVLERELQWHEVPQEIRDEMIRNGLDTAEIDMKKSVEGMVVEQAKKQKIELTVGSRV